MHDGILGLIGHTPLIQLSRYLADSPLELYAKLEFYNPGGSIKDRPALNMLQDALTQGLIDADSTLIESSSGNLGVGLAQACGYLGLRFICVTDARATVMNRCILEAYGAMVDVVTEPDPVVGTFLAARLKRVQHLLDTIPNSFNCNQYTNPLNPAAHHQTIDEIMETLGGNVDYIFCATSTCGTLRGFADYIAEHGLSTQLIAVDAVGSVIFGDTPKPRLIPGHGAGVTPMHYRPGLEDAFLHVSDLDCIVGCRRLMRREAIFAGGSSGGVLYAVESMRDRLPPGSTCVIVLADRGARYLDTIYNDEWVCTHFGQVTHLWEGIPYSGNVLIPSGHE
ncbi:MAG: 2,3-diaminopropionate biosynthesis protein SbnA [Bacteroidota bacterium]